MSHAEAPTVHVHHASFAAWTAPGLVAASVWGPHGGDDLAAFFTFLGWARRTLPLPFDYLVDASRIRVSDHDWSAFAVVMRWWREHRLLMAPAIRRGIVVVPGHVVGVAIAGSARLLRLPFDASVTTRLEVALARLERPDAATLEPWIRGLPARAGVTLALRERLRDHLARAPDATSAGAARPLGVGPRSLQRRLGALGTSFRALRQRTGEPGEEGA